MEKLSAVPIRYVKGIGPKREQVFQKNGCFSIEDLLYYFPRRYEDRTTFIPVKDLKEGPVQTIRAKVLSIAQRISFRRRRFSITEAIVSDESGSILCVWFNQRFIKDYLKAGQEAVFYGKVERYGSRIQMSAPEFELIEDIDASLSVGRIVPIYPLPQGIGQRSFRRIIKHALDAYLHELQDFLPYPVRSRQELLNLAKSLINIHFPENQDIQKQAYTRLAFEEFFIFLLPLAIRKARRKEKAGIAHTVEGALVDSFFEKLPFTLTQAQQKAFFEIKEDMRRPLVMQRLLQGDVGSGKTVLATLSALIAIQGGYQAVMMAPTEILARQHFEKIKLQVTGVRYQGKEIIIRLMTGSGDKKEKEVLLQEIKKGKAQLVIGTHALLEAEVDFKNLGLVVIDEQHKFGVGQRALLPKKGHSPDVLIMTATPIPRTLAITLYGDLDISVINELPPGRQPIKTRFFSGKEKAQAYVRVKEELKKGSQAYIVYPVIEESQALDIAGAKKMYEHFKQSVFKEYKIGLMHGKLTQKEQDEVMNKFRDKELDLLVSTTVLEVGIDVANATCMVIQHAERFGLSQLHQLRGRVGRGTKESFCFLIADPQTEEAHARISAMVASSDGFRIAEEDLKIRGPGEFFGSRQHGLTELKIANPLTQMHLLKSAREEANNLIAADPCLSERQHAQLKEKLLQRFPEYEKLMMVA